MTIDLNRLKAMRREELIEIAKQVNAPYHHKNAPEKMVESIINTVMQQSLNAPVITAEVKKPEATFLTEEELEAKFAPIKERYKAFSTIYDHESKCVTMRYNDGRHKHSETMSLSCSVPKFMRKAVEIGKGPLLLRTHRTEEWGSVGGSPKNAYADVVLG